jgi:sugar (pentulose or hexulose) kinase
MSVSTIAAAGSSLLWAREQWFRDLSIDAFRSLVQRLSRRREGNQNDGVTFEPYLAGERASVEQRRAAFTGLTLATTR